MKTERPSEIQTAFDIEFCWYMTQAAFDRGAGYGLLKTLNLVFRLPLVCLFIGFDAVAVFTQHLKCYFVFRMFFLDLIRLTYFKAPFL